MSSRLREARAHREQAVRILQKYSEEYPQWPEVKAQLASAQVMLAQFLMGLGEHELAHETCQSALHRWETLVFEFPDMLDYQVGLAGTQHNMSSILVAQGKAEEGLPMLTRARDRLQKTLERSGRHGKSDTLLLSVYDSLAETRRLLKQDLNDASKDEFQARRVKTAGEALRPSKFLTDLSSSAAQRRTVCASKRWFLV